MQELLGRIAALDPDASLGIRVIACFDELILGDVNTRGLLATAASLAGCPAGAKTGAGRSELRLGPSGDVLTGARPDDVTVSQLPGGVHVWLERSGSPHANDAIILERLALAVGVRAGIERRDIEPRRDLRVVLDSATSASERAEAAGRLGLDATRTHRVVAAPLFAVWESHPAGPSDVISTAFGPVHATVVPATTTELDVRPSGVGIATPIDELEASFRTALVAVRLCRPPSDPFVCADRYGGLIQLLADAGPSTTATSDSARIATVMAHPWADSTIEAILATSSVRQAARHAGVHHSTAQTRSELLRAEVGFDFQDGYGRIRLGLAYLAWRLDSSRVFDLPAPG
ncbi:PucR family transcriptional regulator [Gordonia hongkongensis]|uniref:PucR family transcriptional regulator n=1 Tax=Gordonia hongkongensis TaxID=1701090 RepID=UPI001FFA7824|nr:PucR family transcriptional regulator [Gordonia hongkongensis]UPG68025.1 PucR family transcriptional regulator [Gordonia hongkongensis]